MIVSILQFMKAKGAGDILLRRFLSLPVVLNDPSNFCQLTEKWLQNSLKIKENLALNIINEFENAKTLANELAQQKISVLWLGHPSYPKRIITQLQEKAPPVLFCKGNHDLLTLNSVGFCGSRKASEKGIEVTNKCARQLVQKNICVISGYAQGVDLTAHKSALSNNGTTIFILAEGILKFKYKHEIKDLLYPENHLIISQFPPNLAWVAHNAMHRNGTIIGLSDAIILVESGKNGGTFATGEETLSFGLPLFVIDFAAPGPSAEANPYFIKRGGIAIRGNTSGEPNLKTLFDSVTSKNLHNHTQVEKIHGTELHIRTVNKMEHGNLFD